MADNSSLENLPSIQYLQNLMNTIAYGPVFTQSEAMKKLQSLIALQNLDQSPLSVGDSNDGSSTDNSLFGFLVQKANLLGPSMNQFVMSNQDIGASTSTDSTVVYGGCSNMNEFGCNLSEVSMINSGAAATMALPSLPSTDQMTSLEDTSGNNVPDFWYAGDEDDGMGLDDIIGGRAEIREVGAAEEAYEEFFTVENES